MDERVFIWAGCANQSQWFPRCPLLWGSQCHFTNMKMMVAFLGTRTHVRTDKIVRAILNCTSRDLRLIEEPPLLDYLTFSIMLGTCLAKLHSFPTKPCKLKQLQGSPSCPLPQCPCKQHAHFPQVICQVAP